MDEVMDDKIQVDEDWKTEVANEKANMETVDPNEPVWVDFREVKNFLMHISGALAQIGANIHQTIEVIETQIIKDKENGEQTNDED